MYIAIQVQSRRENLAIRSIQERLAAYGITGISIEKIERKVVKPFGKGLKETSENLAPGYLIADVRVPWSDQLYYVIAKAQGVIRLFWESPISKDEFARFQSIAKTGVVQIEEPEIPKYRKENMVLSVMEKAATAPGLLPELAARLREAMAKIRERQRQYQQYVKNICYFDTFKRFTGRKNVLEFPLQALEAAKRRLFCVSFGWDNPMQLATRLAISMVHLH